MLVFRSMTLGLLGACVLLLARLPLARPGTAAPSPVMMAAAPPAETIQVVDVAPGVADVVGLIRLAPDERVIAVDDRPVSSTLVAGAQIAAAARPSGAFVDLTVVGHATSRRVLVLMH